MNEISPQQLLTQIRAMQADLHSASAQPAATAGEPGFAALFKDAIGQVNQTQLHAGEMKRSFETGATDLSLAEVMIASQKADLSFRAMTEVRNKLITAYQEIMNMPV